jgi:UDP-glucose 4-epimerase
MDVRTAAVFGGSGKVGRHAIPLLQRRGLIVRALAHRTPIVSAGVQTVAGSVTDAEAVREVVHGADVVLQLATAKEDPATFFDVSVRGTLNILEACRLERPRQFILLGGDAAFGIWFYPQPIPIDETHPLTAYPGYYAFSKVMEEVMAGQYAVQYGLPFTILRSSWIFEGADLLNHFSLLKNVDPAEPGHGFGAQPASVMRLVRGGREHIPILMNRLGVPYHRHIVHIADVMQALNLVVGNESALGHSFNIASPAAFDYRVAAEYLAEKMSLPTVEITCPDYHSFAINISKARAMLGYDPQYDFFAMADDALACAAQER